MSYLSFWLLVYIIISAWETRAQEDTVEILFGILCWVVHRFIVSTTLTHLISCLFRQENPFVTYLAAIKSEKRAFQSSWLPQKTLLGNLLREVTLCLQQQVKAYKHKISILILPTPISGTRSQYFSIYPINITKRGSHTFIILTAHKHA